MNKIKEPAYMEQICRSMRLNSGLDCAEWFEEAFKHCTQLTLQTSTPNPCFWSDIKDYLFQITGLQHFLRDAHPQVFLNPKNLNVHKCREMLKGFAEDFGPRVFAWTVDVEWTNYLQFMANVTLIMLACSLVLFLIMTYQAQEKTSRSNGRKEEEEDDVSEEESLECSVDLRIAKAETRCLRVVHFIQPEDVLKPNGRMALLLRMRTRLNFGDGIIEVAMPGKGHLMRQECSEDALISTLDDQVMESISQSRCILNVAVVFEEDALEEKARMAAKNSSRNKRVPCKQLPK